MDICSFCKKNEVRKLKNGNYSNFCSLSAREELLFLRALEDAGVDNWHGYSDAQNTLREWLLNGSV